MHKSVAVALSSQKLQVHNALQEMLLWTGERYIPKTAIMAVNILNLTLIQNGNDFYFSVWRKTCCHVNSIHSV